MPRKAVQSKPADSAPAEEVTTTNPPAAQEEPKTDRERKEAENLLKDRWEEAGQNQASALDASEGQLPPTLSVAAGINLFLRTLRGQSPQTYKTYRVGCRVFMYFLYETERGQPAELPVVELPPLILEDYYIWLVERYSRTNRATVSGYMAGPRNLFSYLARRDLTPGDVQYSKMVGGLSRLVGRAGYKTPRVDYSETRKLAEFMYKLPIPALPTTNRDGQVVVPDYLNEEISATENNPDLELRRRLEKQLYTAKRKLNPKEVALRRLELLRDRALILTLYTTGMRREEVSRLNRNDVRDGRLEEALISGKGEKERVVFFDEPTLNAVREYINARQDAYQPLFIQHRVSRGAPKAGGSNYRLSPFSIWAVVQKWAKEVGVEVNPHDFRHALATSMLNNGAQLSEVQDVLGHASPVTTKMIYAHYERKTLRAAIRKHRVGIDENPADKRSTD